MPQKINGINLGSKRKGEKEIQKKEKKERALTAEKSVSLSVVRSIKKVNLNVVLNVLCLTYLKK